MPPRARNQTRGAYRTGAAKPPDMDLSDMFQFLGQGLRRQAAQPNILGYQPHPKQLVFHEAPERGRLYLGGNRSGKTTAGIIEDLWWVTRRHPYRQIPSDIAIRGRVIGDGFETGNVDQVLIPEFKRWILPSDLINGSWEDSYQKGEHKLTLENESFIEFKSFQQDVQSHAGTSRHFCVDKDTKILSKNGWADYSSLTSSDEILTRNNETGNYEWMYVNFVYRAKSERMYRLASRNNFEALVTGDHRWLVYNKSTKKTYYTTTDKLKTSEQLIVSCVDSEIHNEQVYSDSLVALVGWLITDGHIHHNGTNMCIAQSFSYNEDKCKEIELHLNNIGADYYITKSGYATNGNPGILHGYQLRGVIREQLRSIVGNDKELPYWFINSLTRAQLDILMDAIIKGDGQYLPSGKWTVTSSNAQHIDAVTYLAVLCGYRVNNYPTLHDWSVINAKSPTSDRYDYTKVSVDSLKITVEEYNDVVWCPNTDNGNFVAYRKGRVFLTGNCHFDEEPPQDLYIENMLRLVDTAGLWWITLTPVNGMTWVYDELVDPFNRGALKNITVVQVATTDNPFIDPAVLEEMLQTGDDADRESRLFGKFTEKGGMIFPEFSGAHLITNAKGWKPPPGWRVYMSLDHGLNNPTAILWHAVSPENHIITFKEHYASNMIVKDHTAIIRQIETAYNLEIFARPADPATNQRSGITGTSIIQAYAEEGIYLLTTTIPRDVKTGLDKMRMYMRPSNDGPPHWQIIEDECPNLIRELKRLHWKTYRSGRTNSGLNKLEEVHKKDDHAFDSSRYFFTMMPDLSPDSLWHAGDDPVVGQHKLPSYTDTMIKMSQYNQIKATPPKDIWNRQSSGFAQEEYASALISGWEDD